MKLTRFYRKRSRPVGATTAPNLTSVWHFLHSVVDTVSSFGADVGNLPFNEPLTATADILFLGGRTFVADYPFFPWKRSRRTLFLCDLDSGHNSINRRINMDTKKKRPADFSFQTNKMQQPRKSGDPRSAKSCWIFQTHGKLSKDKLVQG